MKEIKIKMIIVGDTGVGKTSILKMYNNKQFNNIYSPTIGVDFLKVDFNYDNDVFNMYIWDTSGQDNFKYMTHSFYTNITVALVVYDITSKQSLMNTMNWIDDIKKKTKECYIFLVGNKIDLDKHREVKIEDLQLILTLMRIDEKQSIECSCKDNINIKTIFDRIIEQINKDILLGKLKSTDNNGLKVYNNKKLVEVNKTKECCIIL